MGIEKTEIKKAAYVDVGLALEKMRDQEELQVAEHKGAAKALRELLKHVVAVGTSEAVEAEYARYIKKLEAREKELAELEERDPGAVSMGPMDTVKFGIELIIRAARQVESMAQSEKNKELIAQGALQSYEASIQAVKKQVDVAQAQIERQLLTDEEGDPEHSADLSIERPTGVRPVGLKAQRLAEEAADKPSKPEPAPEPPPPTPVVSKTVSLPKAVSPTEVTPADVKPVAPTKPKKKATRKKKGRLESKFSNNGVRK